MNKAQQLVLSDTSSKQEIFEAPEDTYINQIRIINKTSSAATIQISYGLFDKIRFDKKNKRRSLANVSSRKYKVSPTKSDFFDDTLLTGELVIPGTVAVDILDVPMMLEERQHIFATTSSYASFEVVLFYISKETDLIPQQSKDGTEYVPESSKGWGQKK